MVVAPIEDGQAAGTAGFPVKQGLGGPKLPPVTMAQVVPGVTQLTAVLAPVRQSPLVKSRKTSSPPG